MPDETAVLEPATAAAAAETPGEPQGDTAETEELTSTETEETQESPTSPFAGKTFDEIAEDPEVARVVKDRLAKAEESARQKNEAAQARALHEQEARQYQQMRSQVATQSAQWAANTLRAASDKAIEEGKSLDPQSVEWIAGQLNQSALIAANEALVRTAEGFLTRNHPEFRIPQDLNRAFGAAQAQQDIPRMWDALMSIVETSTKERLSKDIRAEIEKELADTTTAEKAVEGERQASKAARSAPRPVGSAATATKASSPDDVLSDPMSSVAARRQAWKAKYGEDL